MLWAINTTADVAVTTTAKTVLGVDAPANAVVRLRGVHLDFESVTASDGPALIEIISAAEEGTATSATPVALDRTHTATAAFQGQINHTIEPSSPTVVLQMQYPVQGSVDIPIPYPDGIKSAAGGFLGIRVTTPQSQNCRGYLLVED